MLVAIIFRGLDALDTELEPLLGCRTMAVVRAVDPMVVIVILNWNGKEDTAECIDSLKRIDYSNHRILVVDNGSTDGSAEWFDRMYPEIEVVRNKKNLGYTGGNNIGIRRAIILSADYVLLLNNDTIVDSGFLTELINAVGHDKSIGIAGPTVFDYGSNSSVQATGAIVRWYTGSTTRIELGTTGCDDARRRIEVDFVSGSCLLARTSIIERVGYLDDCFFAHWEEIDWCVGAKNAGYKVVWAPNARIWHKCGATGGRIPGFREYHNGRNRFWFMKKRANRRQFIFFLLYFFCFDFWKRTMIYVVYYRDVNALIAFLHGTFDGISQYPCPRTFTSEGLPP